MRGLVQQLRDVARRHAKLLAYLIPTTLALAAVQTWFQSGTVVAMGDLTPPFAPESDYISHWNHLANGAGGPSYLVSQFPYYELLIGAHAVGASAEIVQRLWLSTLFAGTAAAGVFLALSVTQSPIAGGVAGVLLAFNPYRLVTGPDPVPLAALMLAGLLGGILLRAALAGRSGTPQLAAFALVSTGLGYVFINPPHVLLLLVWLVACTGVAWAAGGIRGLGMAWGFLARAAPLVLLVNLWWVVPAALTISSPSFQEQFTAASPSSWAWTHRRASLLNAVSLNTAWGWNEAAYFPYASQLDRFPFVQLRMFLPVLGLMGLLVVRKRMRLVAVALGTIALVGVVIAKGYHPPMAQLNAWFYEHLPGYWLLRDPMKALLLTTLAFCVMGGLVVDRLARLRASMRPAGVAIALVLVGGTLASVYPIYTGAVVPDSRPLLPPAHVQVPEAWGDAARFVNALPRGRVLVLPAAAYYQLGTTWGYYGASFLAHLIHQPLIELTPGGYLSAGGSMSEVVNATQHRILAGDGHRARRYLRTLGVRYVLLRLDLDRRSSLHPVVPSGPLAHGLSSLPDLRPIRTFEHLVVYELEGGEHSEVHAAIPMRFAGSSAEVVSALDVAGPVHSLVQDPAGNNRSPSLDEVASPGGQVRIFRTEDESLWEAWLVFRAGTLRLRLIDQVQMTIDDARVPPLKPIEVDLGVDPPAIVEIGTNRYPVKEILSRPVRLGLTRLSVRENVRVWQRLKSADIPLTTAGPVSDCDRADARTPEQVGLSRSVLSVGGVPTLQLSARDHAACVNFPVEPLDKAALYRVSFEYRTVDGSGSRACLFEDGPERCAALPALISSPGWHRVDEVIVPHRTTTGLRLFFYADGTGEGVATAQYRGVRVSAVAPTAPVLLGASRPNVRLPDIRYVRVGPSELRARVVGAIDPYLLVLRESFAAGWKIEVTGRDGALAQHVRVDGYANGWVVPWQGSYDVRFYYEPEALARIARWADLVIIPAVLGLFIVVSRRNRGKKVRRLWSPEALEQPTQNQEAEFTQ